MCAQRPLACCPCATAPAPPPTRTHARTHPSVPTNGGRMCEGRRAGSGCVCPHRGAVCPAVPPSEQPCMLCHCQRLAPSPDAREAARVCGCRDRLGRLTCVCVVGKRAEGSLCAHWPWGWGARDHPTPRPTLPQSATAAPKRRRQEPDSAADAGDDAAVKAVKVEADATASVAAAAAKAAAAAVDVKPEAAPTVPTSTPAALPTAVVRNADSDSDSDRCVTGHSWGPLRVPAAGPSVPCSPGVGWSGGGGCCAQERSCGTFPHPNLRAPRPGCMHTCAFPDPMCLPCC